jgi:hypothetical protein
MSLLFITIIITTTGKREEVGKGFIIYWTFSGDGIETDRRLSCTRTDQGRAALTFFSLGRRKQVERER